MEQLGNILGNIKALILDFGGVLLNLDFARCRSEFLKLGLKDFAQLYDPPHQTELFDQFETGQISPKEFRERIKPLVRPGVADAEIDAAWNALLGEFPPARVRRLETLKRNHKLFLLSNTNAIHFECFEHQIIRPAYSRGLSDFFDKAYYSFEVGLRKPDPKIFELVLEEHGLTPEQALFVDDAISNIEAAARLGLHTHYLNLMAGETFERAFPLD